VFAVRLGNVEKSMVAHATKFRRARQRGQELIEFTLMLFVILGFIYMIIDISWMVFTRASLQYAVREGCRYAVANGYDNPSYVPANTAANEKTSILAAVRANSMGFLNSSTAVCSNPITTTPCINVNWYLPTALNTPVSLATFPNCDASPYVVEVDVVNYPQTPLFGIFLEKSIKTFYFTASSADVME
jgi:Flp pilus assembly protein TadG